MLNVTLVQVDWFNLSLIPFHTGWAPACGITAVGAKDLADMLLINSTIEVLL